jgi:DNA-binding HxlR family transcriptional regulator
MTTPKPGTPVRGSRTGRPIMALLDLLGRRWTLRILWELRAKPLSFRSLREQCGGISPTVLNQRLGEMRAARIVTLLKGGGYVLTSEGHELLQLLGPLRTWAERWAANSEAGGRPAETPGGKADGPSAGG